MPSSFVTAVSAEVIIMQMHGRLLQVSMESKIKNYSEEIAENYLNHSVSFSAMQDNYLIINHSTTEILNVIDFVKNMCVGK